tara:strand:- start:893 stop:1114 length:222 start_codon:yes stop_codon:yes gene_type:complete
MEDITEVYKIIEYLDRRNKTEWSALLHGILIYLEENASDDDDDGVDLSEEEGAAVPEGVPEVAIDEQGFQSLK